VTDLRFLLDTNILIYLAERESEPVLARAEQCGPGELATSAIVLAEFARGINWTAHRAEETLALLLERVPVLPFNEAAARSYGRLPFVRHRFDRLIAAHALALDVTLVTANVPDFVGVSGLRVEDWSK
jgi:tRNA(fMet)-specific endonuclease VapC